MQNIEVLKHHCRKQLLDDVMVISYVTVPDVEGMPWKSRDEGRIHSEVEP